MFFNDTPDIGKDLMRIHSVITRGLYVALGYSHSSAMGRTINESKNRGFISYVKSLITVMNSHHKLEDNIVYPYLKYRMSQVPFDMLKAQHRDIMNDLDSIEKTMEEPMSSRSFGEHLGVLNRKLNETKERWHPHIEVEEKYLTTDKIDAAIGYGEQKRLSRIFNEYMHEQAVPDYLVEPFLLYNLPPEERDAYSRKIPSSIAKQVTSESWKEKWMPMSTFMLL